MPQDFTSGNVLTAAQMDTLSGAVDGYATTATAAGTTTLTTASMYQQFFTGSTTQTVVMPVASTLYTGQKFRVVNNSSGVVTVQSSGANTIYAVPAGGDVIFTCILASGTSAASWDYKNATAAASGGGKVLQVVFASTSTVTTSTSTTMADTSLTATITPTLNTSKVLVMVSQNGVLKDSTASQRVVLQLMRGATVISKITDRGNWQDSTAQFLAAGLSIQWLDSPATTSATTYKTQFARGIASGTVYVQTGEAADTTVSTITLLEIGA